MRLDTRPRATRRIAAATLVKPVAAFADGVRAFDWWDFKLVPILTIFYAGTVRHGGSVWAALPALLLLFGALVPGAVYVSLINDWTDLAQDVLAAKRNRMLDRGRVVPAVGIGACLAVGGAFCWLWRDDPWLLLCYVAAWCAFTLYSVPPLRLKVRGFAGILADAGGSSMFPALLAAGLAVPPAARMGDGWWTGTVAVWALAYGLRGIVWHQLSDADADRTAGVGTFVVRHGAKAARVFGERIVAPVELAALILLLRQLDSPATLVALVGYYLYWEIRVRLLDIRPIVVAPRPRAALAGQQFYDLFLPLALLAQSAWYHPLDLIVLVSHLLCFPRRPVQFVKSVRKARYVVRQRRLAPSRD